VLQILTFFDPQVRSSHYYADGPFYCMSASLMDTVEKYFR